ncbi:MAG: His/Gly/Thr/Pro-type tRNA ligase C-terminal domain-containing protein, partial [bacterium]|nr:His/Gly/Thr/Pro-type tRNA ligase C-terminal domain-containing protein [bacterium]
DLSAKDRTNLECGGNETDYHLINVNFERDFPTPEFADIREVKAGDSCSDCEKGSLKIENGIELGHIFQLGRRYSEPMKINFVDEDGQSKPVEMGCYGIGMTRLIGATIETCHDQKGIVWPKNIAPYQVHLIGLNLDKDESIRQKADQLYEDLKAAGVEVLFDDRKVSPGNKFADSDLIGIPLRLTISPRSLEGGGLEWKERKSDTSEIVAENELVKKISHFFNS